MSGGLALALGAAAWGAEACGDGTDDDLDGLLDCADPECGLAPECCGAAGDADGDGWCGPLDRCGLVPDPGQADQDGDGAGDACDVCPTRPGDGLSGFAQRSLAGAGPVEGTVVAPADLDGDGDLDLVYAWTRLTGLTDDLSWLEALPDGTFRRHFLGRIYARGLSATDLDGDGDADVVYWTADTLGWVENDGAGFRAPQDLVADLSVEDVADLDGDGDADVLYAARSQPRLVVDVVLRDRWDEDGGYCGSPTVPYALQEVTGNATDALDLSHARWTEGTSTGPWLLDGTLEEGANACEDRGFPYDRTRASGAVAVCWRYADGRGGPDRIRCAEGAGDGTYATTPLAPQNGPVGDQDHVAFDLDGEARLLAHRSVEDAGGSLTARIRVRFLDDPADPELVLATGPAVDFPDLAVSSTGVYSVVWQDGTGAASSIEMASCAPATADCADLASWEYATVDTGQSLRHPQLATDGDRQFVVYMENVGTDLELRTRVSFATRCRGGGFVHERVQEPADPDWDQSIHWGRSHVDVDRVSRVVHVAWVEADDWVALMDQPTDAEVWWAARPYLACP